MSFPERNCDYPSSEIYHEEERFYPKSGFSTASYKQDKINPYVVRSPNYNESFLLDDIEDINMYGDIYPTMSLSPTEYIPNRYVDYSFERDSFPQHRCYGLRYHMCDPKEVPVNSASSASRTSSSGKSSKDRYHYSPDTDSSRCFSDEYFNSQNTVCYRPDYVCNAPPRDIHSNTTSSGYEASRRLGSTSSSTRMMDASPSPQAISSDTPKQHDLAVFDRDLAEGDDVSLAKLKSGEEKRRSVMIRNIPNKYTEESVESIMRSVVGERFKITRMPLDCNTGRNLGYCFIQFTTINDLIRAYENLQNKLWPFSESHKTCRFCYSKIQHEKKKRNRKPKKHVSTNDFLSSERTACLNDTPAFIVNAVHDQEIDAIGRSL